MRQRRYRIAPSLWQVTAVLPRMSLVLSRSQHAARRTVSEPFASLARFLTDTTKKPGARSPLGNDTSLPRRTIHRSGQDGNSQHITRPRRGSMKRPAMCLILHTSMNSVGDMSRRLTWHFRGFSRRQGDASSFQRWLTRSSCGVQEEFGLKEQCNRCGGSSKWCSRCHTTTE